MSTIHRYLGGRFERYTGDGFKLASRYGWFFLSLRTAVYAFHLELGPLSIAVDSCKRRKRSKR